MAVGLASWSVCAWAQADGPSHAGADSYRAQLEAEASDGQQSSASDASGREAYKDRLRRLSGDASPSDTRSTSSQNSAASEKGVDEGKTATSAIVESGESTSGSQTSDAGTGGQGGVQPVALETSARSLSSIVLPPQVSPGSDCSDAYCQQLRRVADGAKP